MRVRIGAMPKAADFGPTAPWRPIREPSVWMMQLMALPLGALMAFAVAALWAMLTPAREVIPSFSLAGTLALCGGIIVVHELVHAVVYPGFGLSDRTIVGVWPSRGVFYAHYDGELTRERFVAVYLMPLVVISFGPLLVCATLHQGPEWLAFISWVNAFAACGDVFGTALVLSQIPARAIVRSQGWRTYWREGEMVPVGATRGWQVWPWAIVTFVVCLIGAAMVSSSRDEPVAVQVVGHTTNVVGFKFALVAVTNLSNRDYDVRCVAEVFEKARWQQAFMQENSFHRFEPIWAGGTIQREIPIPADALKWRLKLECSRRPGRLTILMRKVLTIAGFTTKRSAVTVTAEME